MKVACHRAYVRDESWRGARFGTSCEAVDVLRREAGWLLDLWRSAGVELHERRDPLTARVVVAVELDAWQEAAYRGVMP